MYAISSFKCKENKHGYTQVNIALKKNCESLRKHVMKIINFKKKKMNTSNYVKMQKVVKFVNKRLKINRLKIKNIVKLQITVRCYA